MSRRSQALFIGLFLLIIYGVPVSQAVVEVWRGHMPQALDLFTRAPGKEALRNYEKDLERSSIYAEGLRPWMQYLTYLVLRSPGEKAILGRDGWLFYKPDVQYLVDPRGPVAERAQEDPHLRAPFQGAFCGRFVGAPGRHSVCPGLV
jgi:hypothetical protein